MKFAYTGTTRDGQTKSGLIDASNLADAEARLRTMQITPTKLKRSLGSIELQIPGFGGVKVKTLVVFTRQLATMIDAGLPLVQCLDILGSQEPDKQFQKIIMGVKQHVESGSTLAEALKRYPKVFDTLFVSLVAAGEVGGILDTILNRLAVYLEKNMKTRQKVKGALKYPAFVMFAAVGIIGVMLWKVVPSFAGMFSSLGGAKLPALTQLIVDLSNKFISMLPLIILGTAALITGYVMFHRTAFGKLTVDRFMIWMPVIGNLLLKGAVARFTRTLGTLVSSGVPILDGLEVVAKSAGNMVIENAVMYTRARVAEGKNIAGPLEETHIFPKMVVQMIAVGESTGAMDVMLTKIADFYDDEVDAAVDGLTSLIEPMIMVVIGGAVGVILIAMYLPIFGMAENLAKKQ